MSTVEATWSGQGCSRESRKGSRGTTIILILTLASVSSADGLVVDGSEGNQMQNGHLRALWDPYIKGEQPPNCLPGGKAYKTENYCGFIMKSPGRFDGGVHLYSNASGSSSSGIMQLAVMLSNPYYYPYDVGIYVTGNVIWEFPLPLGMKLTTNLSMPTLSKVGGDDYHEGQKVVGKATYFTIHLDAQIDIPGHGKVEAKSGPSKGRAFVATLVGAPPAAAYHIQVTVVAIGEAFGKETQVAFIGNIFRWNVPFQPWTMKGDFRVHIADKGRHFETYHLKAFDFQV
ncbi:hypothetical protein FOZ63_014207 [Perkinsus olseni]|uniref:Uncharacterized protein n=1 Tax=Perkinsus olseni TaxID=32597 RepID=A0A7J6QDN2_PEROL|nr:hypothetical protein FOZ63_014207 [Perkinsus olseni]KAF4725947.1 hypothetical protein FOZ62_008484 [Perkinsus olseni]